MRVLDLFSGTGSATQAFKDRGHEVTTVELSPIPGSEPTITADVFDLSPAALGGFDFCWASPPCTHFSQAGISHHWEKVGERQYRPRHEGAQRSADLFAHTRSLLDDIGAPYIIENPRSMLRHLPCAAGLPRVTVWYCQYHDGEGVKRAKPTDLWLGNGAFEIFRFRPECKNNNPACDHERAPRGAKTGTQGMKGAAERSTVEYGLSLDLCMQMEWFHAWGVSA